MNNVKFLFVLSIIMLMINCKSETKKWEVTAYETAANQTPMKLIETKETKGETVNITIDTKERLQTITGFGGAITQSSAYLLNKMSEANRNKIISAYFSEEGANYSFIRTHINSCDFSTHQYAYAVVDGDTDLTSFDISRDKEDIIPIIKAAQNVSKEGFKVLASPWTAPPWMKDNKNWVGGKLLPKYYDTWALYFSKYIKAYEQEGIPIWGLTVENEPLGNGNNWESMHYTPSEMNTFVANHLGPRLEQDGLKAINILGYDQNREELKVWVDTMYGDEKAAKYYAGTAVHWYESTFEYFGEALQYAHKKAPTKYLMQTEACVDAEVPHWQDDNWYWQAEATDWGWDWAPEDKKHLHPKYVPVYRYARDIIGCLNNRVDAWIDWNIVLDKQGGPNWFKNWCVAPIIVDPEKDEVYFTPLYYTMSHFSKFIRPGATVLGSTCDDKDIMVVAAQNPDQTYAIVVFNPQDQTKKISLDFNGQTFPIQISGRALQTIIINN